MTGRQRLGREGSLSRSRVPTLSVEVRALSIESATHPGQGRTLSVESAHSPGRGSGSRPGWSAARETEPRPVGREPGPRVRGPAFSRHGVINLDREGRALSVESPSLGLQSHALARVVGRSRGLSRYSLPRSREPRPGERPSVPRAPGLSGSRARLSAQAGRVLRERGAEELAGVTVIARGDAHHRRT